MYSSLKKTFCIETETCRKHRLDSGMFKSRSLGLEIGHDRGSSLNKSTYMYKKGIILKVLLKKQLARKVVTCVKASVFLGKVNSNLFQS